MTKVTPDAIAKAEIAGGEAAARGENCVPAHCTTYREIIAGFRVGEGAAHLAQSWINGYRKVVAEKVADLAIKPLNF